jgi:hypothetical protein
MNSDIKRIVSDYNVIKHQFNLAKNNYANRLRNILFHEISVLLKQSNRIDSIGFVVYNYDGIEVDYINGVYNGDDSEELDWYIPKHLLETEYYDDSIHDIDDSSIIDKCNELISVVDKELMVVMFGDNVLVTINKQSEPTISFNHYNN